ncbi:MAG: NADH-quinone oxidoreductase subunit N [Coriobacteriia bacterium]|nr:NADH-quinone oxidoreductase subunit N [Coriobacteriia bacterium]
MTGYALIIPELLLLAGALWALFAELLPGKDRGAAWIGAALSLAAGVLVALQGVGGQGPFGDLLAFDGSARAARIAVAFLTTAWLLWTAERGEGRIREAVSLAMFAALGAMLMSEARELMTLVMAVELATIPAYVLMGYRRANIRSLEGALKYFLLSMLTSLVMFYGFSFVYGLSGTTRYAGLDLSGAGSLGLLAVLLAAVGMFSKLSAAPFHFWAPDAYEGADAWAVAFVSTVPKVAGAVALVRLLAAIAPGIASVGTVVLVVSVVSMLLGNLGALTQGDVRRLMAYSGVAHTGYLLLGASTLAAAGFSSAVFYALAYAAPSLGVMLVAAEVGPGLADFDGLAKHRPATAWAVVVLLFSLIGIPPLVGFFGKLNLFTAALAGGSTASIVAVIIAVVMSVVSAGYYLRIVRAMFFGEPAEQPAAAASPIASLALTLCVLAVIAAGLGAGVVLGSLGTLAL